MNVYVPLPDDINVDEIRKILGIRIKPTIIPIVIDPQSKASDCFQNVKMKIMSDGGSIVHGWAIWKSEVLIEAEFHAIWKNAENETTDITPPIIPTNKILFIEDPITKYNGSNIDNIRLNISANQLVDDLISISRCIYSLQNYGSRANQLQIKLNESESNELKFMYEFKENLIDWIRVNGNKNGLCICGSGEKYKRCHYKDLEYICKKYLEQK